MAKAILSLTLTALVVSCVSLTDAPGELRHKKCLEYAPDRCACLWRGEYMGPELRRDALDFYADFSCRGARVMGFRVERIY